jgi:hypothetical protein
MDIYWEQIEQNPLTFKVMMTIPIAIIYMCILFMVVYCDYKEKPSPQKQGSEANRSILVEIWNKNFIGSMLFIFISLGVIACNLLYRSPLEESVGEPYALIEGVSMWSSQVIRLVTFVLASYFIVKVFHFPDKFQSWLEEPLNFNTITIHPKEMKSSSKFNLVLYCQYFSLHSVQFSHTAAQGIRQSNCAAVYKITWL